MPTDRLLRIVESNDTSTHFVASASGRGTRDHAVDDRLAVLGFAGLEVGRVDARLDEIALGIDPEQPQRLAADLAADDERGVEADLVLLQVLAVAPLDVAHRVRDQHRDVEHRPRAPEIGDASPAAQRWFSTPITACVPARLPELSSTMTRSPRRSNTVILQNLAKLSMPALVRESEAKIIPSSSITPMQ